MTLRVLLPAAALLAASLATSVATAHEANQMPRARPLALGALSNPDLAPAHALMHSVLSPGHRAMPETPTRGLLSFFSFGWFHAPLARQDAPRCETVFTPFSGRIETCSGAPVRIEPHATTDENRAEQMMRSLRARIDNH